MFELQRCGDGRRPEGVMDSRSMALSAQMKPYSYGGNFSGGRMAKESAIYMFTRDARSPQGFMSRNEAATDAEGVVLNWATVEGRSFQTLLDQHEIYVAYLAFDGGRRQEAADDLDRRCVEKGLTRVGITEKQLEELRTAG